MNARWIFVSIFLACAGMVFADAPATKTTTSKTSKTPKSAFVKNPWPQKAGVVQVYILAGQSNMQGHASVRTLESLVYQDATAKRYQHWKDRMGAWTTRNDVWVWTTDGDRRGTLQPGFGGSEMKIGPELGFGETIANASDQQTLLIKTCWGGRSVKVDFLPPSAKQPTEKQFQEILAKKKKQRLKRLRKKKPDATAADVKLTLADVKAPYGKAYRDMIAQTKTVLKEFPTTLARQPGIRYELAGFVFFQGWNDMCDGEQRNENFVRYTTRLAALIRDVRKDLDAPNLPVVIGGIGVGGETDVNKNILALRNAQEAAAKTPGLNHVRYVSTAPYWDKQAATLREKGVWKGPDWPRFYNVASEGGYHYLGSAKTMIKIGDAFAKTMLTMKPKPAATEKRTAENASGKK